MGPIKRGALIVVEGVDRSGKSTQCKQLVQSLENLDIKARLLSFPDRSTQTGKLIDEYLRNKECKLNDHAIHLLFSANRWENVEKMKSWLNDGITLIVDRYSYSGIAFSAVKKNMDLDWCKHPEDGLPKPDLVFLLMLSQEEMMMRPGFGKERYENLTVQAEVADMYKRLSEEDNNWTVVDAARNVDDVHSELLGKCLKVIAEAKTASLGSLRFCSNKKVLS
ncbi:thymidylate kinase isoform X2 [Anoplophora glabripennis]|uniref:Thymidylate kinase n=2 Tax=Anoplophora glabripennis TaxID=217634 RepID=V5GJC1_ANOGL|nr:thymidylate kinase isoform X2 [Anoplophora glabripennis]